MFKFFKESIKEFEHVVWPTKNETRKYFSIVVWLIVCLTLFIFVISSVFSAWLFYAKNAIHPSSAISSQNPASTSNNPTNLKLDNIVTSWSTSWVKK